MCSTRRRKMTHNCTDVSLSLQLCRCRSEPIQGIYTFRTFEISFSHAFAWLIDNRLSFETSICRMMLNDDGKRDKLNYETKEPFATRDQPLSDRHYSTILTNAKTAPFCVSMLANFSSWHPISPKAQNANSTIFKLLLWLLISCRIIDIESISSSRILLGKKPHLAR